ncbi:MAG: hypothetical protein JNK46_13850, partial [Methylobacteriaceae bacterium]|nr:hypothetical protein [Methylobacteriaceae bacterium]
MSDALQAAAPKSAGIAPAPGLAHLPLPLFAAPMGIGGLGMAWREAARVFGAPAAIGEALMGLAAATWLVIFALHLMRLMRHRDAFAADMKHPIRSAFAGAATIGLMLVAAAARPFAEAVAAAIWLVAVVGHLALGAALVRGLLLAPREAATLTPALLIPLVGNILAPLIGARLGFASLSWMLFGIGALLWAMIQPVILWRLIVGPPLMDRLRPTLVILLAPPAVGSLALAALTGEWGPAALAAYGLAAFLAAALVGLLPGFLAMSFAMS